MTAVLVVVTSLALLSLAALVLLLTRKPTIDLTPLLGRIDATERSNERLERSLRDDFARQREELRVQLASIRSTVDEQLQGTLERRLGESFNIVSERLEQVHKGLGEMQSLAAGVGDLKKVLTNVKTRGTWGEVQLGALLDQMLTPAQYAQNVCTKGEGGERVEFAIRLPGRSRDGTPMRPRHCRQVRRAAADHRLRHHVSAD